MRLIIHDLAEEDFVKIMPDPPGDTRIITNDHEIHNCIGCFGCWIKTPAVCIIRDKYGDMGATLSQSSQVTIISQCFYGGFSPFVKNILDRSISFIHPYFRIKDGRMHHRPRYRNKFDLSVWFYGEEMTEEEKKTAEKLVNANAINLDCNTQRVSFVREIEELEGRL